MNRPATIGGQFGRVRILLAIGALAVIVVVAVIALGGSDEPSGAADLQVRATARNTSHDEERFAAKVEGAAGNRIEYSLAAINEGKATLTDVAITFTAPTFATTLVAGSCRVRRPGADFVKCSDRLRPSDLSAERLRAGERLEARVAYTLDSPPCRTGSAPAEATSDSAQTPIAGPAVAAVSYTGLSGRLPRCGTKLAQLLAAVPAATRATCREWPGLDQPVLARIQCQPKQGAKYAVYLQYRTPAITAQVYRLIADRDKPRSCGAFKRGSGTVQEPDGKRVVTCSAGTGGAAHLTWYDDGASVFAYADGVDGNRDALLAWWRRDG